MLTLSPALSVDEARESLRTGAGLKIEGGCYLWEAPAPNGYGPFLSFWIAEHGEPPVDGYEIEWTCRNGPNGCVNPGCMREVNSEEKSKRRAELLDGTDRDAWVKAMCAERKVRNWSQQRMANELQVSLSTIKNWERGKTAPTRPVARMVAYKLGWELSLRRMVVTVIVQETVAARTAAEAATKVMDGLGLQPPRKKGTLYSCRIAK